MHLTARAMAAALLSLLILLLVPSAHSQDTPAAAGGPLMTDASALLQLKSSFTNASALSSWSAASDVAANPCNPKSPWTGLVCFHGVVTGLRLNDMGLGGTIDVSALTHLKGLRTISFARNHLSGTIPPLTPLDGLKAIYLQNNSFSGEIPADLFAQMDHLKKLWLSGNSFTGSIPSSLAKATTLIELHLDHNQFSGLIPDLPLPALTSFDISHNALVGPVPPSLAKFNASAFDGNSLCGGPYAPCVHSGPDVIVGGGRGGPQDGDTMPVPTNRPQGSGKMAGVFVVIVLLVCVLVVGLTAMRRHGEGDFETLGVANREVEDGGAVLKDDSDLDGKGSYDGAPAAQPRRQPSHRRTGSSVKSGGSGGAAAGAGGGLVVVNESKGAIGMPDLMKAAAEVLGSGGMGSAYKAVMSNGESVVVKRMRDMNKVGKEMFDVEMRRLGRLRHRNVLTPLAYHYRKDEKLLVLEFVPKGSLLYILHGDRGPDHAALDWPTRLKIIRGIASGMAYLHTELNSLDIPHGNLKSGNVLLAADFEPLLVDFGFISLVNPSQASVAMFAYKSPESVEQRHISPKSDVYCLGILILEILTGKFPSQYLNNTKGGTDVVQWATSAIAEGREAELLDPAITATAKSSVPDMVRLIRVGAFCVEADPDLRPGMKEAAARVEEVGAAVEKAAGVAPAPTLMGGFAEQLSGSNQWRTKSISGSARRGDDGFAFS